MPIILKPTTVDGLGSFEIYLHFKNFLTMKDGYPMNSFILYSNTTRFIFVNIKQIYFILEVSIVILEQLKTFF